MTVAGSPALDRHVPRSEDRARIEAALKVARGAVAMVDAIYDTFPADQLAFALGGLTGVIEILDGRDTQAPQAETPAAQAKPPHTTGER